MQAPKRRDSRPDRSNPLAGVTRPMWLGLVALVVVVAALGGYFATRGGGTSLPLSPASAAGKLTPAPAPGPKGPEDVPIPKAQQLAPAAAIDLGQEIDGIKCETNEQVAYHIHIHLTIFVNGAERLVPYGIGIAAPRQGDQTAVGFFVTSGSCFAWLHTHASDGIIHVESPTKKTYALGDFFDVWQQPLSATQVGPAKGHVTAFYNGKLYTGNPRDLPLDRHAQIQLDVGKPLVAPEKISFPNGL